MAALRKVQRQVKDICLRLERPGGAGDLFLLPAPSEPELAAVKHCVECTLQGVAEEDRAPPPTRLPEAPQPPMPAAAAPAPAAPLAGGAAAGGKGGQAGGGAPQAAAAAAATTKAAAAAAATAARNMDPPPPKALDWRGLPTWAAVAALLDSSGGFEGGAASEASALAPWLLQHLAKRPGR